MAWPGSPGGPSLRWGAPSTTVVRPINPPQQTGTNGGMRVQSEGLLVRFSPLKGITPKAALDRPIWLPALLNTLEIAEDATHNQFETLSAGEFSMPAMGGSKALKLRTSSLDSLIMDFDAPFIVASGQNPRELRTRLYEILRSKKPVRMLITFNPDRHGVEFDGEITFRTLNRQLRPAENESRYLTLTIADWRDQRTKRRGVKGSGDSSGNFGPAYTGWGGSRWKAGDLPTTTVLRAGLTLNNLAFEFYGNYADWRLIRDANSIPHRFGPQTPIVSLGGRFKVGAKVKIPRAK